MSNPGPPNTFHFESESQLPVGHAVLSAQSFESSPSFWHADGNAKCAALNSSSPCPQGFPPAEPLAQYWNATLKKFGNQKCLAAPKLDKTEFDFLPFCLVKTSGRGRFEPWPALNELQFSFAPLATGPIPPYRLARFEVETEWPGRPE